MPVSFFSQSLHSPGINHRLVNTFTSIFKEPPPLCWLKWWFGSFDAGLYEVLTHSQYITCSQMTVSSAPMRRGSHRKEDAPKTEIYPFIRTLYFQHFRCFTLSSGRRWKPDTNSWSLAWQSALQAQLHLCVGIRMFEVRNVVKRRGVVGGNEKLQI